MASNATPKPKTTRKVLTEEEKAALKMWGTVPSDWHATAKSWYLSLREIKREWSLSEISHARFLAEEMSEYKLTVPRNGAMLKTIFAEMEKFYTTPKSIDDAENARPTVVEDFAPDPALIGDFMVSIAKGYQK